MKTCLIVDDSKVIRAVARRMVTELGFQAGEAEDGQQALDACKSARPDAILLDWNMPVMNGIEFLNALPSVTNGTKPFVIFCTTESSMDYIQTALAAGADEYIMKPFDREILESKFRQIGLLT
jgi:two-component system chemotaxis response regulator CheY